MCYDTYKELQRLTMQGQRATMAKRTKTPFDTVTSSLGQLDRGELEELQVVVAAYLAALTEDEEDDDQGETGEVVAPNGRAARGHVEEKTINGCGPYLYLRYWEGKTLKSKYLGKKKG